MIEIIGIINTPSNKAGTAKWKGSSLRTVVRPIAPKDIITTA
jgi:hypothetical protein